MMNPAKLTAYSGKGASMTGETSGDAPVDARTEKRLRHIAIVGGGTAGWVAASMLARALYNYGCAISVIESPDIPTVGVGEATIPPFVDLLRFLDINLADFVRQTQATYKLGIKFADWRTPGSSYWHPFGTFGAPINRRPFFHAWHKAQAEGAAPAFNDFSLCAALGDQSKFLFPHAGDAGPAGGLRYALHFDAGLVARYLRAYAERMGVTRIERTVAGATQRADGFLDELVFTDNSRLKADLYIDCSGFRGLLIEQTLNTGYVDWSHLLPCDRAVAMQTGVAKQRPPYTLAAARAAGWRWRIPLQNRTGNGLVYASAHMDDQAAQDLLMSEVGEAPVSEPRLLRFTAGRRKAFWNRNCIALGLASGFLEPLESTSIHLVVSGVYSLMEHLPDLDFEPGNIAAYNDELIAEMEHARDFIVLHYCLTERDDAPLWRHCRQMALPDSLTERIETYRRGGRIRPRPGELFTDLSWFYVYEGMGLRPQRYDPLMDVVQPGQLRDILGRLAAEAAAVARAAPSHDSYFGG